MDWIGNYAMIVSFVINPCPAQPPQVMSNTLQMWQTREDCHRWIFLVVLTPLYTYHVYDIDRTFGWISIWILTKYDHFYSRCQTDLEVDKLYEPKQNKKIVRIFTVILYMFSVRYIMIGITTKSFHSISFKTSELTFQPRRNTSLLILRLPVEEPPHSSSSS